VIESRVGMEFDSLLEVTEFYKNYTYSKGFATMIRNSRKNKGFTETSYINLKCNREGTYSSSVDDASKKRSTIKKIRVKLGSKLRWILPIGNGGYWALLRIIIMI
jgi:hypothetical protein